MMFDGCGRKIEYLRVSLTDACNLHCRYCRPPGALSAVNVLSADEIVRAVRIFARLGIKKVRLTGGEPLLRSDLPWLVSRIKGIDGIDEVALTTNGTLLTSKLKELYKAGLDAVNVSLDTLDRKRYRELTGEDKLSDVLGALEGLAELPVRVKINSVLLKNVNEADILPLADLARERNLTVRFITLMPIGCVLKSELCGLSLAEARGQLEKKLGCMEKIFSGVIGGPAVYYRPAGFCGQVGFIDALNERFCSTCNRVRVTADGFCKLCLYSAEGMDLRALMRTESDDGKIYEVLRQLIMKKPAGHNFAGEKTAETRFMYQVGG